MVACDSWAAVGKPEPHALPCTITGRECTARTAVFLPSSCLSCLLASLRIGLTQLHDACVRCRCVRRNLTLSRYTGKVYSLLVSNFRHVLLIDADSMPVQVRVSVWGGRAGLWVLPCCLPTLQSTLHLPQPLDPSLARGILFAHRSAPSTAKAPLWAMDAAAACFG